MMRDIRFAMVQKRRICNCKSSSSQRAQKLASAMTSRKCGETSARTTSRACLHNGAQRGTESNRFEKNSNIIEQDQTESDSVSRATEPTHLNGRIDAADVIHQPLGNTRPRATFFWVRLSSLSATPPQAGKAARLATHMFGISRDFCPVSSSKLSPPCWRYASPCGRYGRGYSGV